MHKGVYWETDSFILKDHSLVEKRDRTNIIRIKNINLKEEGKEDHKLSFTLEDYGKKARAHVFGFTFMPSYLSQNFSQIENVSRDWSSLDIFPFANWKNIYQSNRKLGDEFRYVFDRKFLKRFMGNTLDRPQLLLNRHKLRETQFDQEIVHSGTAYQQHVEETKHVQQQVKMQQLAAPMYAISNAAPMMQQQLYGMSNMQQNMYQQQNIAPMGFSENMQINAPISSMGYDRAGPGCGSSYKSFLNFLNNSAEVVSNLVPDAEGNITCSIDTEKYSTILILAMDENTVSQSNVDVTSALEEIEKRDLSLSAPLDPNKHYNEMRNTELLRNGDSHVIEDITSTDYIMIDSLEKVQQVQTEIQKVLSRYSPTELDFLTTWHTLSAEDKHKKYSRFMCHEVNLFLFFKDPDYFKEVVRPFIANKMEKSFVDHWLLGNEEEVLKYKSLEYIDQLNTMEKCLLTAVLVKHNKEEAQAIVDRIRLMAEKKELKIDDKNRIFDTVINLNMGQDDQDHMDGDDGIHPNRHVLTGASQEIRFGGIITPGGHRGGGRGRGKGYGKVGARRAGAPRTQQKMRRNVGGKAPRKMMAKKDMESDDDEDSSGSEDNDDYDELRKTTKVQFQEAEVATEYCETHYYNNPHILNPGLIEENEFWVDFAQHIVYNGTYDKFMSSNFISATTGHTQAIGVLSVISLPWTAPRQDIKSHGGRGVDISAVDNMILFKKEIKEAEAELDNNILVIHRFFDPNNKNSEAKIKEFLINKVYGCETIITNVSTKSQDFQILWQIPEGSLPLQNINYQKSENKKLNSYSTTTFEYYFYFPHQGNFIQFPSNITIENKVVAVANECKFEVVEERTEVSNETFRDIMLSGDNDSIIEFLATANLYKGEKGFNFSDILWMLKDKDFFLRVTDTLRNRKIYDDLIWKYSLHHKDYQTMKESIMKNNVLLPQTGTFFESDLIKCSPATSNFRHLDYFPMINARAHKLGDNANPGILNRQFRQTYNNLLKTLIEKPKLDEIDLLNMTYYFLLQDRINEAIEIFQRVDPKHFDNHKTLKMQYDYMRAYLDFFIGSETDFKVAMSISKKYADYPILSWKVLFTEILDQLEEFKEGVDYDEDIDNEDETKRKANLKKSINLEPTLHCELEKTQIKVEYNNIKELLVKYYVMDPEVMFSRTPFLNQNTEDFAYVKPMEKQVIDLDKKLKSDQFEILEKFQNQNLVIEVTGEGKQAFLTYFATSLKVAINENLVS